MHVLSLFSGIGGFDLALHDQTTSIQFSEIEPSSADVFLKHFPEATPLGDVRKIDWSAIRPVDFIVAGSPCTDVSSAATLRPKDKVRGLQGDKSSLLTYFLEAIETFPAAHFILENVKSMTTRTKQEFTRVISAAASGRPVYCNEIDACAFTGVHRKRIFWTSWPVGPVGDRTLGDAPPSWTDALLPVEDVRDWAHTDRGVAYMNRTVKGGRTHWDFNFHQDSDRATGRTLTSNLHKGVPYNVLIDRRVDPPLIRKMVPEELEVMMGFPRGWTRTGASGKRISNTQRYKMLGNSLVPQVICHLLASLPAAAEKVAASASSSTPTDDPCSGQTPVRATQ